MKNKTAFFFLIALSVFVLDQLAKYLIRTYIGPFDVIRVLPFFNIVYVENIGSAFGMFKGLGNTFFVIIALLAMALISALIIRDKDNRLIFSLILGGTAGNLMDRIIHGYVIDFLDVYAGRYHWPAFNVADSALTIGVALLICKTFFNFSRNA
ncbi:MAG: signal peptidase II [Nitrospirae bacterium]|nr:signal peptidase II [Nitrospirota bacterium]